MVFGAIFVLWQKIYYVFLGSYGWRLFLGKVSGLPVIPLCEIICLDIKILSISEAVAEGISLCCLQRMWVIMHFYPLSAVCI